MSVSKSVQSMSIKAKGFVKHNSPTILTVVGVAGVVATSVATAKAATKASILLNLVEEEKGAKLTLGEKVKVAAPAYFPAILLGTATITCILGANIMSKRKQASLIGAYTMLDNSFKEYKKKLLELYGKEVHNDVVDEIVREATKDVEHDDEDGLELFYDLYSNRYFRNTLENVLKAEIEINKRMHTGYGDASVNDLYALLGLEPMEEFDQMGWNSMAMEEMYWHAWIVFEHRKTMLDDGMECTILEFPLEPIVDYLEY